VTSVDPVTCCVFVLAPAKCGCGSASGRISWLVAIVAQRVRFPRHATFHLVVQRLVES